MRKNTLVAGLILLLNISLNGQEVLSYSKIIQTDSVGKTILFVTLNDWFASTYSSANEVIQMADKEAGVIIGKGVIKYDYGKMIYNCYDGYINYTIKAYVKDNRYKVELENFRHTVLPGASSLCELGLITTSEFYSEKKSSQNNYNNKVWSDIKTKVWGFSKDIYTSLENETKNLKSGNEGDVW